jgi:hypothetical protein
MNNQECEKVRTSEWDWRVLLEGNFEKSRAAFVSASLSVCSVPSPLVIAPKAAILSGPLLLLRPS